MAIGIPNHPWIKTATESAQHTHHTNNHTRVHTGKTSQMSILIMANTKDSYPITIMQSIWQRETTALARRLPARKTLLQLRCDHKPNQCLKSTTKPASIPSPPCFRYCTIPACTTWIHWIVNEHIPDNVTAQWTSQSSCFRKPIIYYKLNPEQQFFQRGPKLAFAGAILSKSSSLKQITVRWEGWFRGR